jgi:hypothetical protein
MKFLKLVSFGILISFQIHAQKFFTTSAPDVLKDQKILKPLPKVFDLVKVDLTGLKIELAKSPKERTGGIIAEYGHLVSLPMEGGLIYSFKIADIPVMEGNAQDKYPEIKTYTGQCVEHPSYTLKLDITPHGLNATIFGDEDIYLIAPVKNGSDLHFLYKFSNQVGIDPFACGSNEILKTGGAIDGPVVQSVTVGTELRTYRLAVTTTTEFTAFFGGTVSGALAGIASHVNRVNGVYERDLSIRFNLVSNNNLLIYSTTNDPYDPVTDDNAKLDLVNSTINSKITSAGYDIGHLFGSRGPVGCGGGGIASLGVVCGSQKGRGLSYGNDCVLNDAWFSLYIISHEIGHQFGAEHTFNSSCGNNRNGATAWEPGQGNSIMAYSSAGCEHGSNDGGSIFFFHSGSFNQIVTFTTTGGAGYGCAAKSATGNAAPTVSAGSNFYVPRSTPMLLSGTASDATEDMNALTTSWDQIDAGPISPPASPTENAPLFRFQTPSTNKFRYLPALSSVLSNTTTVGEVLPGYGRRFRMHMMVRDNRAGGGATRFDSSSYYVVSTAGPFVITAPTSATSITENTNLTVTWNRANTHLAPISTANVSISLSVDGGTSFFNILSSTPNDGTQTILIPAGSKSNTARIKISALGNIYFAVTPNLIINGGAVCYPPAGYSACNVGEFGLYPVNNFSIANSTGTVTLMSNLNTGCPASGAYSDYAGDVGRRPQLLKGSTYRLQAQTCTGTGCLGTVFGYYIDLNGDGFFNGTGEYLGGTTLNSTALSTFNWTVPTSYADGFYRLRVKSAWNVTPQAGEACNAIVNGGEVEDYLIFVSNYCGPSYVIGCSQGDVISNFTLGSFTNNSGTTCPNQNQKGAYTLSTGPTLFNNSTYNLSINAGTGFTQQVGVWIDFNNNFSFSDAGEFVYGSTAQATSFNGTITIPGNAAFVGTRRMRVRTQGDGTFGGWLATAACETRTYGETEDYTITIQALNRGTLASGNQTICNGGTPSSIAFSTVPSGAASFTYLWYFQNNLVAAPTGNDLTGWTSTGVTTQSFSPPAGLTVSRTYACLVTPAGGVAGWASGVRQVTVLPVFNPGTITSGDETFCNSGNPANITLSTLPGGSGGFTYKWYYKETSVGVCPTGSSTTGWLLSSGTLSSFDPSSAGTVGQGRTFAVLVTPVANGSIPACGTPQWANNCRKTFVNSCSGFTPGVLANGNQTICNGTAAAQIVFSTAATTGSTFQWYFKTGIAAAPANTEPITGWSPVTPTATGSTFTPPSLTSSITYACRVTNGANSQWATGVRQITVRSIFNPGTITAGIDVKYCNSADPAPISFSALPSGANGSFTYQWYYKDLSVGCPSGSSVAGWTLLSGATNATLDLTALQQPSGNRTYACFVTSTGTPSGCGAGWASGCAKVEILSPARYGTITSGDQTICSGSVPNSIVLSQEPAGSTAYDFQWYSAPISTPCPTGSSTTGWTIAPGISNTISYSPPALSVSTSYSLRVTPKGANTCASAGWVTSCRKVTVTTCTANTITLASVPANLCNGSNLSVSFSTTGTFNAGNTFSVQVSPLAGSYSTVGSGTTTTINVNLPSSFSGSGHSFRIVSSNPVVTSNIIPGINILPPVSAGSLITNQSGCPGYNPLPVTMATNPLGSGAYNWKWFYVENTTAACPSGTADPAGWTSSTTDTRFFGTSTTGTGISFDPSSAGSGTGRTWALKITPTANGAIPGCGPAQFASTCHKTLIVPCKMEVVGQMEFESTVPSMAQNIPNPFSQSTKIAVFLPENTETAKIRISSLEGKTLQEIPIQGTGSQELEIQKSNIPSGVYFYSLFVNGIPTINKKMIVRH